MDDFPSSEIWIGNLLAYASERDVREALRPYGVVHFCHVGHHPNPSMPMAYAKVTMGSVAEASRVLASLNGVAVPSISGSHGLVVRYGRVSAGGAAPGSPKCAAGSPRGSAAAQWADEAAANLPWPIPLYGVLSSAASTPRAAANGGGGASSASGMPAAAAGVGSGGSSGGAGCAASSASGTPATPKPLPVKPAVQRCASCGTPESVELVLRRCSACKCVAYCCTLCQHRDWEQRHAGECATLRALSATLAAQPGLAGTMRAALEQPGSALGLGVRTLVQARVEAVEVAAAGLAKEAPAQSAAQQEEPAAAPPAAGPAAAAAPSGAAAAAAAVEAPGEAAAAAAARTPVEEAQQEPAAAKREAPAEEQHEAGAAVDEDEGQTAAAVAAAAVAAAVAAAHGQAPERPAPAAQEAKPAATAADACTAAADLEVQDVAAAAAAAAVAAATGAATAAEQ